MFHVGIDWASDHHDIVAVDDAGRKTAVFRVAHTREGLEALREKLRELCQSAGGKEHVHIGIETSRLLLVDVLLNDGYVIYPLNPKAVDRYRDRYTASGAKSDVFDAELIAQALRTDGERFRPVLPDSELLRELRILVRDQRRFIRTKTLFLNQLRSCLKDYYPAVLELFQDFDAPVALAFLKEYPRPAPVAAKKLEKLMRAHHQPYVAEKARKMAEALARQIPVEEFAARARSRSMLTLVEQLESLRARLAAYAEEIETLFERHPDASIFKGLPGAGSGNAPRLLCEIGDNRNRYPGPDSLQGEAGTSPVTKSSGKNRWVLMRRACRKTFRDTVHQFSFCSLNRSAWARDLYDRQKAKGQSHSSALRAVGDKWLKIIHKLWKERINYDENIFLADRMRHQFRHAPAAA